MIQLNLVSPEDVQDLCLELGISDLYLDPTKLTIDDVRKIMVAMEVTSGKVSTEDLMKGMLVEFEHGTARPETNITNNHPYLTANIALAHLAEFATYYDALAEMERKLEEE